MLTAVVSTVLVVVLVVVGALVLVAAALAPRLGRGVPDDVVAPARSGYGRAPELVARTGDPCVARGAAGAHDHDLAA